MCDNNKCGGGNNNRKDDCKSIEGPPQNLPQWFRCPPVMRERTYPVPDGVNIKPISQGGRNGKNSKKQFKCGQCGQDAKKAKEAKPNAPADCPMMKARCPGAMDKITDMAKGGLEGKGSASSVVDRIKNFFGGKNEKLGLVDICKALMVQDDQITHHRDVFSSELFCGKDGYYSPFPFFTKVDCQGRPEDCNCPEEEEEEECEEWEEDDEEEECEEEEEEPQCNCDESNGGGDNQEEVQDAGGGGDEEEECVQDGEGECILEESAECLDESCKLFMDKLKDKKKDDAASFEEYCKNSTPENDCSAMNNFIIRVSSPTSSGASTNETCEQIIARLTQKQYPEPGPVKEKKEKQEGCEPKEVEIVVKQICVAKPTCECPPKCKDPPPPPPPPPKDDCQKPPPPPPPKDDCQKPPPPPKDECEKPPLPPPPKDNCEKPPPPPPKDDCEKPPPPKDNCGCEEPPPPPPPDCEPPPEDDCQRPPRGPPPNDCAILSELELLRKPIKQIKCGCPKFLCSKCESDAPGASYAGENSVWIPPPPPPCARCGASERGGTEGCYLCQLTRRMRLGIEEKKDCINFPRLNDDDCEVEEKPKEEPDDLCTPEYLPDGSVKYKGGMCLSWAGTFLWKVFKREPPGGFFDRYTGECGEDARLKALGNGLSEFNDSAEKDKHLGGESIENTRRYLWGEKRIDENEEQDKKKKGTCKNKDEGKEKKANQCPPRREE